MRVWLQKQKKKEEAKAAAQAATPPVEVTPAAPEVQPVSEGAEKPVDSVEEPPQAENGVAEEAAGSAGNAEETGQRAGSASAHPNEVGFQCLFLCFRIGVLESYSKERGKEKNKLKRIHFSKNANSLLHVPMTVKCLYSTYRGH
jgi:hypothetical protein